MLFRVLVLISSFLVTFLIDFYPAASSNSKDGKE
jgi:hypothetical protein